MAEGKEKEYGFGQGENIVTIVQRTPVGTEVIEAKASELDTLELAAPGPGIEHEVIPTAPRGDQPVAPGATEALAPVERRTVPAAEVIDVNAAKAGPTGPTGPAATTTTAAAATGPRARLASGGVGPDPKQEAVKTVSVKQADAKPASRTRR